MIIIINSDNLVVEYCTEREQYRISIFKDFHFVDELWVNSLEYGVIMGFDNGVELWYEPITDEYDGFVFRNTNTSIMQVILNEYTENM